MNGEGSADTMPQSQSPETTERVDTKDNTRPRDNRPAARGRIGRMIPGRKKTDPIENIRADLSEVTQSSEPHVDTAKGESKKEILQEITDLAQSGDIKGAVVRYVEFTKLPIPEDKKDFYLKDIPSAIEELLTATGKEGNDDEIAAKREQLNKLTEDLPWGARKLLNAGVSRIVRFGQKGIPVGADSDGKTSLMEREDVGAAPPEEDKFVPSEEKEATKSVNQLLEEAGKLVASDASPQDKIPKLERMMLKLKVIANTKVPKKWYLPFLGGKTIKDNAWGTFGVLLFIAGTIIIAYLGGVASMGRLGGKG